MDKNIEMTLEESILIDLFRWQVFDLYKYNYYVYV